MKPKTYTFSTFQEAMDIIPADKLELAFTEVGRGFAQAKHVLEAGLAVFKAAGLPEPEDQGITVPDTITWIDDNKGVVDIGIGNGVRIVSTNAPKKD